MTTSFVKYAGAVATVAMCSACGGASMGAPLRPATILPDRNTTSKDFEYVSSVSGTAIFDYPKSDQQIGSFKNTGGQGCTNVLYGYGKKYFWFVSGPNQITEYEVLKKPVLTLAVTEGMPSGCTMDTSGDLAVGILSGSGGGDVVIFKNARGSGTPIATPLRGTYFDGYDNKGNLFADGFTGSEHFELVELLKRTTKVQTITTSNTVQFPGSVQWDGKYLTVFDQLANAFYQYTINGTKATLEDTVTLTGAGDCGQTWIATGIVYCADAGNGDTEVFDYPAGGSAIAVLRSDSYLPLGVTAVAK
jgi:hypothetical protein